MFLSRALAGLLLASVAAGLGCASVRSTQPTVAIAVVMADGGRPPPSLVADIHRALQPHIAAYGYAFAPKARSADYVLHVKFTPDLHAGGGTVSVRHTMRRVEPIQAGEHRTPTGLAGLEQLRRHAQDTLRSSGVEPLR